MFPLKKKDFIITLSLFASVTVLCTLLLSVNTSDTYAPILYTTVVFIISRYTSGYFWGIISSFFGVFMVNFVFTYPFMELNFTMTGYPITFISMLVTSVMTGIMTTQIKRQEAFRMEAEKEKMRSNLLRSVSHDLRTPLTSILGTTSALLDNGDKIPQEKQRELLSECHDDAEWLIRMVENLLSVTRMNSNDTKIVKSMEAVEEVVGEAIRKFNKRFPDTLVTVEAPAELLLVPMDAILTEQVIINLLENAVIHGKSLQTIHLTVSKTEDYAIFDIHDQGVGIREDMFEHLFDGYFSSSNEADITGKRNMGIGLSACAAIVSAHGGTIAAQNHIQGGAVFRFTLPLKEA